MQLTDGSMVGAFIEMVHLLGLCRGVMIRKFVRRHITQEAVLLLAKNAPTMRLYSINDSNRKLHDNPKYYTVLITDSETPD